MAQACEPETQTPGADIENSGEKGCLVLDPEWAEDVNKGSETLDWKGPSPIPLIVSRPFVSRFLNRTWQTSGKKDSGVKAKIMDHSEMQLETVKQNTNVWEKKYVQNEQLAAMLKEEHENDQALIVELMPMTYLYQHQQLWMLVPKTGPGTVTEPQQPASEPLMESMEVLDKPNPNDSTEVDDAFIESF
ncbi:hypothetical protein Y1Q_0004795 [Alligator mississippiensis]|uniref:Uncharacterized protein n=1 Tax=Alligator mississippiensis TaxID=8496 RepID=A0A151NRP8_ALLMI|nr:hypothetical protein Y1Q_0004795 [Alligator mississippiensis]